MKIYTQDKNNQFTMQDKIMERYFHLVPLEMFKTFQDFLFHEDLTQEQKLEHYEQLKPEIQELKSLFKERTFELNKMAQKEGFRNRVDAALVWNQIPQEKFKEFIQSIDEFISLVMKDEIPIRKLMEQEKDWNKFNTPFPLGNQYTSDKFEIPNQVYGLLVAYDPRALKYKNRLDIQYDTEALYPYSNYNKELDRVEVRLNNTNEDIYEVLSFVRLLGYAFDILDNVELGKDLSKMPIYFYKYSQIKYGFEFLKHYISPEHQKVMRYNLLTTIAMILFEIDIFTNPNQDFDKAYAKAMSRCFPMTHQEENPFYVYYQRFLIRPMGELMESVIQMELYLKDAEPPKP